MRGFDLQFWICKCSMKSFSLFWHRRWGIRHWSNSRARQWVEFLSEQYAQTVCTVCYDRIAVRITYKYRPNSAVQAGGAQAAAHAFSAIFCHLMRSKQAHTSSPTAQHSWFNWKKTRQKLDSKKFVKLTHFTCARNNLTNFEFEVHALNGHQDFSSFRFLSFYCQNADLLTYLQIFSWNPNIHT